VHPKAEDGKLQSVKLTSKQRYDEGLYIWDVERMPQVCVLFPSSRPSPPIKKRSEL